MKQRYIPYIIGAGCLSLCGNPFLVASRELRDAGNALRAGELAAFDVGGFFCTQLYPYALFVLVGVCMLLLGFFAFNFDKRAEHIAKRRAHLRVAISCFAGVVSAYTLWAAAELTPFAPVPWYVRIGALPMILLCAWAGVLWLRHAKFGNAKMTASLIVDGNREVLCGQILLAKSPHIIDNTMRLTLAWKRQRWVRSGNGSSLETHEFWRKTVCVKTQRTGAGTVAEFRFKLPPHAQSSTIGNDTSGVIFWQLKANAKCPGMNYRDSFYVDVQRVLPPTEDTGEALTEFDTERELLDFYRDLTRIAITSGSRSLRVDFPIALNPVFALSMLGFGIFAVAVFVAVFTFADIRIDPTLKPMLVLFWIVVGAGFAFHFAVAFWELLFSSSVEIDASAQTVTIRRAFAGMTLKRQTFSFRDFRSFTVHSARFDSSSNPNLYLTDYSGCKHLAARHIRAPWYPAELAAWLTTKVEQL